jgi:hypothetical protein
MGLRVFFPDCYSPSPISETSPLAPTSPHLARGEPEATSPLAPLPYGGRGRGRGPGVTKTSPRGEPRPWTQPVVTARGVKIDMAVMFSIPSQMPSPPARLGWQAALRHADAQGAFLALLGDLTQVPATPGPAETVSDALRSGTGPWDAGVPLPETREVLVPTLTISDAHMPGGTRGATP